MMGKLLCILDNGDLLSFKNSSFYLNDSLIATCDLPILYRLCSRFRLTTRFLRLEPRCACIVSKQCIVFCQRHKIWLLNIETGHLQFINNCRDDFSDPLSFCYDGESVYYGDYGGNPNHESVNIYKIDNYYRVSIIYQFARGTIRHIHSIVLDKDNKRFWILTGDNESQSGIYIANQDWSVISPVCIGNQQVRAVVAFPFRDGLIFATDSVEYDNFICSITEKGHIEKLTEINGSCIYGTELKDYYIFSTTVEPHEGNNMKSILSNQLGNGIKSRYVHIVAVSKSDLSTRIVAKYKKDWFPMKLFQYGTATFPCNYIPSNKLWYCTMACKRYDGRVSLLSL